MAVTKWLLGLAILLSVAAVVAIPPPPRTPPSMRPSEGWFPWWWRTAEVESPLYRSPSPRDWTGPSDWKAGSESRVVVAIRPSDDHRYHTKLEAPLVGSVQLDTRDLTAASGDLVFQLSSLRDPDGRAIPALAGRDGDIALRLSALRVGTAPRAIGADAWGMLDLSVPGRGDVELEAVVLRQGDDRIGVSTTGAASWSVGEELVPWDDLAAAWGLPQGLDRAVDLYLDLVLVPSGS